MGRTRQGDGNDAGALIAFLPRAALFSLLLLAAAFILLCLLCPLFVLL
jgi:hypothetical protein